MTFLSTERQSRILVLLANLAEGQREFEEIGRMDAQIRIDYHGRFLIELVQNAIDPALKAGVEHARILIVRTPTTLAVLNQGAAFDDAGLTSIIGLGLSAKKPDEAIGNKGVGFKSVFEVARAAEVFGVGPRQENLASSPVLRMRLSRAAAIDQPGLLSEVLGILREAPGLSGKIAARHADVSAEVGRALACSPAWRYPEELPPVEWKRTVAELGLSTAELATFQTAVVLRLAPGTEDTVERAIRDFTGNAQEVHLFLPGVERIELRDPTGDAVLERADILADDTRGLVVRRLRSQLGDDPVVEARFWMATGVVTGPALEAAVADLPGDWKAVRRAEVQVALPIPASDDALAPTGRYYVGLPTRTDTGSPFRVDARFHATLSRTGLDRADNAYNVLLDRKAADIAAGLLRALRDAPADAAVLVDSAMGRRAVTLALTGGSDRAFTSAVRSRLGGEPTVLLDDGETFALPSGARRVADTDAELVGLCEDTCGAASLLFVGIRLVDRHVKAAADALLAELGVPELKASELLSRRDGLSILERAAAALPRTVAPEWATLLGWLARNASAPGRDQRLLPTAGGELATAAEQPFVPLLTDAPSGELSARDIPMSLLADMIFLDPSVLGEDANVRRALMEGEHPLARKPLGSEVIRLAILPALARAAEQHEDSRARELLVLALGLLDHVAQHEAVAAFDWLVPCGDGWRRATDSYLGDAWDADRKEDAPQGLVESVYGPQGRCVVGWWGQTAARTRVRAGLVRAGVALAPRRIKYPKFESVFWGHAHRGQVQSVPAPAPIPESFWRSWLAAISATPGVDWGPETWWQLDCVEWIDGLERPEVRLALAAWALTQAPTTASLTPLSRRKQALSLYQPWIFDIRTIPEPFVPSEPSCTLRGGLARPGDLCRLEQERNVVPWLPRAAAGLNAKMLAAVGVKALNEMPASWLVEQLSVFAGALDPETKMRNGVLARGMWTLLNNRARSEPLPDMVEPALPVWRNGEVVAVTGSSIPGLTIVDDAYAAEVLGDALDGTPLLEPEGENWNPLMERLRASLPRTKVELVSRLPCPYSVVDGVEVVSLLAVLTRTFGEHGVATIAALLRTQKTGVGIKDMERAWTALAAAKVQFGVLPVSAPRAVWLPHAGTLMCQNIDDGELVPSIWPIVGKEWRHELLALGNALSRGERSLRDFMRHEGIGEEAVAAAAARLGFNALFAPSQPPGRFSAAGEPAVPRSVLSAGKDLDDMDESELQPALGRIDFDAARHRLQQAPLPLALPGPSRPSVARLRPAGDGPRSPRQSSTAADEYTRQIGHLGEMFAFRVLAAKLPGFDGACWKSSSRGRLDLAGGDDTLGYDFQYIDITGALCGRPGAECFIEVKANARAMRPRCSVSRNEWNLAEKCHATATQVFVILRVAEIAGDGVIAAIIVDPVQFVNDGAMSLSPREGWWLDGGQSSGPLIPTNGASAYLAK